MSISETESEVIPMCITLRVADTGGIITGGAAQVGRVGVTIRTRSETSWRASSRSVPGLKSSWIDERSATDLERIVSRPGTPFSASSSGTVTRDSTSVEESPRLIVWISTCGGANSGNTSSGVSRSWVKP